MDATHSPGNGRRGEGPTNVLAMIRLLFLLAGALASSGCFGLTARVATLGSDQFQSVVKVAADKRSAQLTVTRLIPYYSVLAPVFDSTYSHQQAKTFTVSLVQTTEAGRYAIATDSEAARRTKSELLEFLGQDEAQIRLLQPPDRWGITGGDRTRRSWYTYPSMVVSPLCIPADIVVDVVAGFGLLIWLASGAPI